VQLHKRRAAFDHEVSSSKFGAFVAQNLLLKE
jgi:hypothetical protein